MLLPRYHDRSIQPYAFDLERAKALLDEAGYKPAADGIRFKLRLTHNSYNDGFKRLAEYLRQNLAKIGIDAKINSHDFSTYIKKVYTDRAFDLTAEYLGNQFDPTLGVQRVYWSKNFKIGLPFSNASHYANPEVDKLLEAASVEIDDNKRKEQFNAFQKIVADEVPVINLIALDNVTVFNRRVKNHTTSAEGTQSNFADVDIKTHRTSGVGIRKYSGCRRPSCRHLRQKAFGQCNCLHQLLGDRAGFPGYTPQRVADGMEIAVHFSISVNHSAIRRLASIPNPVPCGFTSPLASRSCTN